VDALLDDLTLCRTAATKIKDLFGGERRCVSISVEAVHDPAVLILDEPTSGLNNTSALVGRTVLLNIHQSGARIVKMFDSVLLLAVGSRLLRCQRGGGPRARGSWRWRRRCPVARTTAVAGRAAVAVGDGE
jgi:ABC-type uncharacterized transport system ATPase subunit